MIHIVYQTQMKSQRLWRGGAERTPGFSFWFCDLKHKKTAQSRWSGELSAEGLPSSPSVTHSNPLRLRHESLCATLNCAYKWRRSGERVRCDEWQMSEWVPSIKKTPAVSGADKAGLCQHPVNEDKRGGGGGWLVEVWNTLNARRLSGSLSDIFKNGDMVLFFIPWRLSFGGIRSFKNTFREGKWLFSSSRTALYIARRSTGQDSTFVPSVYRFSFKYI